MKNSTSKTGRFFLLVAGLLAVMSACKKENTPSELRAVMNDFANSGQKAYIDPEQYSCFVVNEKIRANNSTGTIVALERNDRQCVIEGVPESNDYYAVYPASLLKHNNADLSHGLNDTSVTLPRVQHYERDAYGNQIIQNPMAAELTGASASNSTLHFRNLCALLKITVQTDDAFDSIRVTIAGKALHGEGTIDATNWKVQMTTPDEEHSVVLAMDGHIASAAGETFYIVIPEVSLSDDTRVTVRLLNGSTSVKAWTYTTAANVTLAANHIHTLGSFIFNSTVFSVSTTKKVYFSPGNLQFWANGCVQEDNLNNGDLVGGTWRFAEHQWDCIGDNPGNSTTNKAARKTQSAWIDLFCWGTSGWNSGAERWTPFGLGQSDKYYNPGGSLSNDLTGDYAKADWGVFNVIYNPLTSINDPAGTWYTMTKDEWVYLLDTRPIPKRFAMAKIGDVNGMLIFPDSWNPTWYQTSNDNDYVASYASNSMTVAVFQQQLESKGVVFLPAAGNQAGPTQTSSGVAEVGVSGSYWSSTCHDGDGYAYGLYFTNRGYNLGEVGSSGKHNRGRCRSVRLVRVVQ